MNTELLPASHGNILKAAELLKSGQLAAFPTETVYGLGADACNPEAVAQIFNVKGRPADNPLIVHVSDAEHADAFADISNTARQLIEAFWPGPLTLVMPRKSIVPDIVTAGLQSVALRCPSHPAAQALLRAFNGGIAAPSANISGHVSPTTARHVYEDLKGKIPMVLDGGPCECGMESTVLSLLKERPVILRPGNVTPEQLHSVVGEVDLAPGILSAPVDEPALSPGMLHTHYTPRTPVCLVGLNDAGNTSAIHKKMAELAVKHGGKCVLIGYSSLKNFADAQHCVIIAVEDDMQNYAARFYGLLRQADAYNADIIYVQAVPKEGVGLALMNRAVRAAGFHTLDV